MTIFNIFLHRNPRSFHRRKDDDVNDMICRAIFENSADGILVMSKDTFVACNPAAIRMFKASCKADILSRCPSDLSPEFQPGGGRSAELASEKLALAAKQGHARFEWTHRRCDGSTFPAQVTLALIQIAGQGLIFCYYQDILELVAASEEKKRVMAKLAGDFEASVGTIVGMVSSAASEMSATAESLTSIAEKTSRQSVAVAAASEQASTNVQTVAGAAEQLSGSVVEISRRVASASAIAATAVAESARSNALVNGLADAAQRVGAVTSLIREIAAQTNLLALNATIEAARAGDAGKGFAVVASEVKALANQTARATEDISTQIAAIQGATNDTVTAIEAIGATIGQINEIAATIAAAVEEQGAATQEIARNIQQAAAGTGEVSSNIAGVTLAASETGTASGQVLAAARELSQQSERLNSEVYSFLSAVKAA